MARRPRWRAPFLRDGIRIKKGKAKRRESCGMMCSVEELGASRGYYPDAPESGILSFQGQRAGIRRSGRHGTAGRGV